MNRGRQAAKRGRDCCWPGRSPPGARAPGELCVAAGLQGRGGEGVRARHSLGFRVKCVVARVLKRGVRRKLKRLRGWWHCLAVVTLGRKVK